MVRVAGIVFASFVLGSEFADARTGSDASHPVFEQRHGWMAPDANAKHPWLYVSDGVANTVDIFDLAKLGIPEIGQIASGLNVPAGATVDSSGTLYVANQNGLNPGGSVAIYPAGATSPSLTLSQGLSIPVDVAVDVSGNVYVSNRGSAPSVVVYAPGQTSPSETIKNALIQVPTQLIFDANGNLYIVDYNTGVLEIPYGSKQPLALGLLEMKDPSAIAIDPLNGNLIVGGNQPNSDGIRVYHAGSTSPIRSLNGDAAHHACYIAIGSVRRSEYLFVPDGATNSLSIYRHDRGNPVTTFQTGARGECSVAFKPAGVP